MRLDDLYLWFLGDPATPRYVGALKLVSAGKGVSLHYAKAWLDSGFALSEDLPLVDTQFLPPGRLSTDSQRAVGAVDDARPDRWGEKVIRFVDKPRRLSLMEYLYYAGDDRFGALGVSTSPDSYSPCKLACQPAISKAWQSASTVQSSWRSVAGLIRPGFSLRRPENRDAARFGASDERCSHAAGKGIFFEMVMNGFALLVVLPTWWAMSVKLAAQGQKTWVCQLKGAAFSAFQLAVMLGLIHLDVWWADLIYVFLMLATGNMVLEAVALRFPHSALGAWWLRQKAAAGRRTG